MNELWQAVQSGEARVVWVEQNQWQRAGLPWTVDGEDALICVAKVTTEISKATSTTRPGSGTIQRYTTCDFTTSPWTLGDLTGTDENAGSINLEKKVAVDSTVIGVKRWGVWWVATPDSCASLLP